MSDNIDNREAVYRVYDDKVAELDATVARLRSILGKLVEAVKSYRKSGGHVMDAARLIELCEEATDAK
jgi:hypothetical protein